MNKLWMVILILALLLSGCSETNPSLDPPVPIEVEFKAIPDQAAAGGITTLQVLVTQGQEPVDDAQEVKFELWQEGQEEHDMIEAESKGDGVYSALEKFHDPGNYHVIYHVTARNMHNMKEVTIQVK